jgi:predicted alpha-1,2-mannosidase
MPDDGSLTAWDHPAAYDNEVETPYYYSTRFDDSLIQTEFTPTARCGYFRFTFPSGKPVVLLGNREPGALTDEGDNHVSGRESFNGMQAFFYGEFSAPVQVRSLSNGDHGRLVITASGGSKDLEFRYGISYISVEQARRNVQEEVGKRPFDAVKDAAMKRWNEVLGQIQVTGGTPEQQRVFYTSLYRCYERMVNITEDGQYYSGYDHQVHADARPFYVDNWIWDMYRAEEPLQTLLNPEMEADKLQSYVRMYQQLGWMPCFAVSWGTFEAMTGNHVAPWMADAWVKGVTNFDLATGYAGLKKNSLEGTWVPWRRGPKCPLDDFLNEHGYMPALHAGEKETEPSVRSFERRQAISVTEAQSYDDWCLAQIARTLGKDSDQALFLKRAEDYKNVFRVDKGHVWPKDAEGKWIEPYDPGFTGGRAYNTENNGYTFDWDVQHDFPGLFELMGGREKAAAKLDELFRLGLGRSKFEFWYTYPDATGLVGQFSMGNEPSLHIPYLYDYLGQPWKTQKRVRMLLDTWFRDNTLGMPGDEDGGGMSAFVVFSMMGFYPVTPGVPVYALTSPVFDKITIQLHNGRTVEIVCRNNSARNKYIQSLKLNGHEMSRVWLTHADLLAGAKLEMQMGNLPNRSLGSNPADLPPSGIDLNPTILRSENPKAESGKPERNPKDVSRRR